MRIREVVSHPITVWVAFVLVHLWLGLLNLFGPGQPLGDVTIVYKFWIDQALVAGYWVGIDAPWVYPILAILPMLAASVLGPEQFASTWLSLVMILNAVAFGFVTGWGRASNRVGVSWWWVGFLVLLGPIALARIDSVTVAIAVIGVLVMSRWPAIAAALLAAATWIKVWPIALLGAAIVALRDRRTILAVALGSSGVVVVAALVLGSGANVFSFFAQQTGRGLQVEAPVSTIWLWQIASGAPNTFVYYDTDILTYQVSGVGVAAVSAVMTPVLALAVVTVTLLGIWANRRGVLAWQLFPLLSLALVSALIVFNKVGSPQFATWLAVPIILGMVARTEMHGTSFRVPAVVALVIAVLTQIVYPYGYAWLLVAHPVILAVLTVRNLLYVALLGWALYMIVRSATGVDRTSPMPKALGTPAGITKRRSTSELSR